MPEIAAAARVKTFLMHIYDHEWKLRHLSRPLRNMLKMEELTPEFEIKKKDKLKTLSGENLEHVDKNRGRSGQCAAVRG